MHIYLLYIHMILKIRERCYHIVSYTGEQIWYSLNELYLTYDTELQIFQIIKNFRIVFNNFLVQSLQYYIGKLVILSVLEHNEKRIY